MVQAKKLRYVKIFLLTWRVVFGNVRFREGVESSTLLTVTTEAPHHVERVSYRWDNEFAELIPFRLIYNTVMFVASLSEIFHERWGQKKMAYI